MAKIQANFVLEILGRPAEHIKSAITELVTKIGTEKGVKIIDKAIQEPIAVKDVKDLFTTFAELTLELDSLQNYLGILFAYMPSHTELIYPEKLTFVNTEVNDLANKLISRLHEYDAITKKALIERDILLKKLNENIQPSPLVNAEAKPKKSKKPKKKKLKNIL